MIWQPSAGPWSVARQSTAGRYIVVVDRDGRTVARVLFSRDDDRSPSDASNAKLIAAAPGLLGVVEAIERDPGACVLPAKIFERARTVLLEMRS